METKRKIVAFGNPLLDTIVLLKDDSLLQKHNLEKDGQKEVSRDEIISLVNAIKEYEKTVAAGGCAQNTLKIMQWLFGKQCSASMFGAVGGDAEGIVLRNLLKIHKVDTNYIVHENLSTGATVALVTGHDRSLVAYLGAAEVISLHDIQSIVDTVPLRDADLIYMEGFFITKRIKAATYILDKCTTMNKEFAFNLSGDYLCREYPETIVLFLKKSKLIFGNKREFEAICASMTEDSVQNLIMSLGKQGKTVVMTDGPHSVICVGNGGMYFEIKVPLLKKEEIIDTTGAGDSFVAGFLTGYLYKKRLDECAKLGCYTAQEIIKRRGCTVPEYSPDFAL